MAEKEKYIINIQGELVEVSPDVYQLYIRLEREEHAQEDRVQRHEVSYDALDNGETVGEEMFADDAPTPEEQAISNEIHDMLHRAIAALPRAERELIKALYFDEIKPEDYAKSIGMTVRGVNKRRVKSLLRLKAFVNIGL